ncbi:hypothetical protein ACAH01_10095 [Halomicrobium sp. HM KBTZ05]|uniref:DUF7261 family protein n=1 Tax=Halomicrobium sp. HM KBTZ05 TaxID=3242663 RepID=UPI003556148A
MADLSHLGRRCRSLGDDRAQVILVAAFVMAVTFVMLALVVNSAIFTENLASRGETAGSDDALLVRQSVEQSTGHAIEYANTHNASDTTTLATSLDESVSTLSALSGEHHASGGKVVSVAGPTDIENGTRIRDDAPGGSSFENASEGGATSVDWRVAHGVAETRAYRMNVSGVNRTGNFGGPADQFRVRIADSAGATWTMNVTHDSADGTYKIGVEDGAGRQGVCAVDDGVDYFHVDLTAGLVDGTPCPALSFGEGVSEPYEIAYEEGDEVTGNYSLIVGEDATSNGNLPSSSTGDDPYATPAIYAANVTYRYDGAKLRYETTIRVAPGEPT